MDTPNLFMEDTDFNICKSWLCNSTDGGTYSINDHFEGKMKCPANMSQDKFFQQTVDFFETYEWNKAIGYKHDYKIDDPEVDKVANKMVKELNALIDRLKEDPDYRYWDDFGVWVLECKKNGEDYFTFRYKGEKRVASQFSADLVITELGDGDGENGGKGSLRNIVKEISETFFDTGRYAYGDCVFDFRNAE